MYADGLTELKQRMEYQSIAVSGGNNAVWFLLCGLIAAMLTANAMDKRDVLAIAGAAGFVGLSACFLLTILPRLGKPLLTITRQGLDMPTYGPIPWDGIESIQTHHMKSRAHGSFGYMLNLHVPSLPGRTERMHPATRLLYRFTGFGSRRTLISIRLARTSVPPTDLLALIQHLWEIRTSR